MRDPTGQARDRRRAVALADSLVEFLDADRQQVDGAEPQASERITLIEFMWTGETGAQPVLLVEREWLQ